MACGPVYGEHTTGTRALSEASGDSCERTRLGPRRIGFNERRTRKSREPTKVSCACTGLFPRCARERIKARQRCAAASMPTPIEATGLRGPGAHGDARPTGPSAMPGRGGAGEVAPRGFNAAGVLASQRGEAAHGARVPNACGVRRARSCEPPTPAQSYLAGDQGIGGLPRETPEAGSCCGRGSWEHRREEEGRKTDVDG